MPWSIDKRDGDFCVVKDANGEVEGCHKTETEARAQIAALNAAENKSANYIKSNNLGLPTTFDELDSMLKEFRFGEALQELLSNYAFLMNNVLDDNFGTETFDKLTGVTEQFVARLSDLKQTYDSQTDGGDAEEEMNQETTLGDSVDMDEVVNVVDEAMDLLDDIASKSKDEIILEVPTTEGSGVFIYKDKEIGTYRWIARYSNNIRDNDSPSEIISAQSHERFDRLVKSGVVPPPELWIWHEKDWRVGQAEWTAIDKINGYTFTVSGGHILPEFQHLAPQLSAQTKDMLVSHGMPKWSVKRDENDASIIVEHITKEISLLPHWAVANPYTGIAISKEQDMAFSQQDKARLMEKHKISPELLDEISQLNAGDIEKAADLELETKDATTEVTAEVETGTEIQEPVETEAETDTVSEGENAQVTDDFLSGQIVKSLEAVMQSVMVLNERFDKEINFLKEKVDNIESSEENRVAEKAATSPLASLTSMMVGSVIGSEAARVDGRTTLAKSKPVEAEYSERHTGIPMIDDFINSGR